MVLGFGGSTKGIMIIWGNFVILVVYELVTFKPQIMLKTILSSFIKVYNTKCHHPLSLLHSDQPSVALRGGAEHTRVGGVRARAFTQIFATPALIPTPFIWHLQYYFATKIIS